MSYICYTHVLFSKEGLARLKIINQTTYCKFLFCSTWILIGWEDSRQQIKFILTHIKTWRLLQFSFYFPWRGASKMEKIKVCEFDMNLFFFHATLYIMQCRILSEKFVFTFKRPWNKFENRYTDKCSRFHVS